MHALSIWQRGIEVNAVASEALKQGANCLDAVEAALRFSEDDLRDSSTGQGGLPNAAGQVELDAAIMFGPSAEAGAVGGLRRTSQAISVARRVMEKTPHMLLVGEGAEAFARQQGFDEFDLLTEDSAAKWQEWRRSREGTDPESHDTMATLAIDDGGQIAGGVTTSGTPFKLPGRVGDSAIIGAGLYVDQAIGAAAATGVGEEAIRVSASFLVVELMRSGLPPDAACGGALERLLASHPASAERQLALAALRADGAAGGGSVKPGFAYAYFDGGQNRLVQVGSVLD